jgi:hypothetical protein
MKKTTKNKSKGMAETILNPKTGKPILNPKTGKPAKAVVRS